MAPDRTGAPPEPLLLHDPGLAADLRQALDVLAERVRVAFRAALVVIRATSEEADQEDVRGLAFADPAHERTFAHAIAALPTQPVGVGRLPLRSGEAVLWPDVLADSPLLAVLSQLEEMGVPSRDLRRVLAGASGLAMPLSSSANPRLGSVTLVRLAGGPPFGAGDRERLEALEAQLSVAVQNAVLRDRNRRARLTLEAVLATTRNGVIVIDRRGRLGLANRAASELVGVDLDAWAGRPLREVVSEVLKWRSADPDADERRILHLLDNPAESSRDELRTVDERVLERYSAPIRDPLGRVIGRLVILSDVTESRRALTEARRLAEEKAGLLEREEARAREEAALARAAQMMSSALTPADVHEQLLDQVARLVPAERCAVMAIDRRGAITPAATRGFPPAAAGRLELRRGQGPLGRVAEGGRAVICTDARADPALASALGPDRVGSFALVPLAVGGRPYGVLVAAGSRPRMFGERELRVLEELARLGAGALQNALLYEQERHIAETLQQALLADELPRVPGLRLGALYRAAAGSLVGGDLYSVWLLPGGEVAVLVGDVSGKGVEAAGAAAMVRHMSEALSLHARDPAELMTQLNGLVQARLREGFHVTAFLAVIDPERDVLTWASAGHPPPLLVRPGGASLGLEDPGPPLGAFAETAYRAHEQPFCPGDLLFLYTDGLVEARREGEAWGEARLREAVLEARREPPDRLAVWVYAAARTWAGGRLGDDVAIAVVARDARSQG